MIVDRRTTLAGLLAATIGGSAVAGPPPAATRGGTALFVDSRLSATPAFRGQRANAPAIDIADAPADLWRAVRAFVPAGRHVHGLTRWSDWVTLRGVLQDKGLRLRAETPLDPALAGGTALFLWEMA